MKKLLILTVGLITAVGLVSTAWGFEISRARTRAEILMDPASDALSMRLQLRADLSGFPPEPPQWTDHFHLLVNSGFTGSVDAPIQLSIPAVCWVPVRIGFGVTGTACGVTMSFGVDATSGMPTPLSILDFRARWVPGSDGTASLVIDAGFTDPSPEDPGWAHTILSVLGGAAVQIMIGGETAIALPSGVVTQGGIQPEPF